MIRRSTAFLVCAAFLLSAVFGVHLMPSVSGIEGIAEPVYLEIADYYDNRRAAVTVTADDWKYGTWQQFEDMCKMLTEKRIHYTGAIITDIANWTQIQYWLNEGYAEAASHSRTHPSTVPYSDYDSEINGSKQDILANLILPPNFSYGSAEYVYTWIQPYNKTDSVVRQKLGDNKYLADREVSTDDGWATWDSTNGLFDPIGFSIKMQSSASNGVDNATILNIKFDSVYDAGQIYHLMTHPRNVNWEPGQYADVHTSHISNRNDVWYVNFGLLYLYHWIDTQNVTQVTSTGSLQDKIFEINISSTDRQNYGTRYPVTYVFDIPPSWTNAYVNYRFRETDPWATMELKTSSDFFNGINAARFDFSVHKAYVSIGFSDLSNEIYLQILPHDSEPTAYFMASPTSGREPLTVSFTDTSTSYDGITSWKWNFGDGSNSTDQNPTHVYEQDGTYTVSLTVYDVDGDNDTETKANYINVTVNQPPVADANGPYTGTEGEVINFDGSGSYDPDGVIVSHFWNFGDSQTSLEQNPAHFYTQNGTYTVTLTVTDDASASETDTTTAKVADTSPTADFSVTPISGSEPLMVSFTDLSSSYDGIVAWEWDFENDGVVDSATQNPTHVYAVDGTYTVVLVVLEGDGSEGAEMKMNYIIVTDTAPTADFSYLPNLAPLTIDFIDESTSHDEIVSWTWDFGDGQTSTEQNLTHKFPDYGVFNVSLTVTDVDGSTDTMTKQVSLRVPNTAPTADFNIVSSQKPTIDEDITFIDQSSDPDGNIVSWFWDFGEGTDSTAQNATHKYSTLRTFSVNLTVTDHDGANGTISKSFTIYDVIPPVTVHDYDGLWHTANFTINLNATDDLSGVQNTYYIINDGPVMNVRTHGQPRITVEGYNRLVYWSVDFYENEEKRARIHDIKLDKTNRPRNMWIIAGIILAIGTASGVGLSWFLTKTPMEKKKPPHASIRRVHPLPAKDMQQKATHIKIIKGVVKRAHPSEEKTSSTTAKD